jgi:hypothetical protein
MRRLHPIRRFSVVALVVGASIGIVTFSGQAWAAGGTVACTDVAGGSNGAALLYSCAPSDTTGGGGSIASPIFRGTHTGTIDWDMLSTSFHPTTVIHVTTHVVKGSKKKKLCPSGSQQLNVTGVVRSDTSGSVSVGGRVLGTLCREPNGNYALAANTSFTIGG